MNGSTRTILTRSALIIALLAMIPLGLNFLPITQLITDRQAYLVSTLLLSIGMILSLLAARVGCPRPGVDFDVQRDDTAPTPGAVDAVLSPAECFTTDADGPCPDPLATVARALSSAETAAHRGATSTASESTPDRRSARLLLECSPEGILGFDRAGNSTYCNPACISLLGCDDESELLGRPVTDLMPEAIVEAAWQQLPRQTAHRREALFRRAGGGRFPAEFYCFPMLGADAAIGAVVSFVDVTERKRAEARLQRDREHAQIALRAIADGVITTDAEDRVRYLNPAAESLLGWAVDEAQGKPLEQVLALSEDDGELHEEALETDERPDHSPENGGKRPLLLTRRCGGQIYIEKSSAEIFGVDGECVGDIIVFRDVSHSRRLAQQLAYQATHDALTGAVNRSEFERRLKRLLNGRCRGAAVCFLDLDQFKVVNDTCGHGAGDELLRQIAQVLCSHLRQRDTLARLGGDEFGILLEHCTLGDAFRVANGIREAVHGFRFGWESKTFSLGVSIGLVEIDGAGGTLAEILSAADTACYMAKEKGRNRVQIHHPEDREVKQIRGEIQWLSLINAALENNRFRLYYQDIVPADHAAGGALGNHVEILVRMIDAQGRLALPGAFLPAAERYNVIQATDRWVVRRVFEWMASPDRASGPALVAINLSGPTISDTTFLDYVLDMVTETGVPTHQVCFEITETAAISKLSTATILIQELGQRGFQFALDDFGSGLASFGYLQNLSVDYVKIDGAFTRNMVGDPINRAMVQSINDIGHIMGKKTIAEFVENTDTLRILREIGVDLAQGYGISRPRPLEQLDGTRLDATGS